MKRVDLKLDNDGDDFYGPAPEYAVPQYPWGVRLCLTNDELEKLGIPTLADAPAVGASVRLDAVGTVVYVSEDGEVPEGQPPRRRVEIQITELGLGAAAKPRSGAGRLYGSAADDDGD